MEVKPVFVLVTSLILNPFKVTILEITHLQTVNIRCVGDEISSNIKSVKAILVF